MTETTAKPAGDSTSDGGKKSTKKKAKKKAKKKKAKLDVSDPAAVVSAVVESVKKKITDFDTGVTGAPVIYFDTGSFALNWCISGLAINGGMPGGRVVEIFGDPSTGKSLIIYKMMAAVCRAGGFIILDDTESCYMEPYAAKLGVDNKRVIPMDSDTVEEHFKRVLVVLADLRSKVGPDVPILIALDSLAMLRTQHEAETEIEKRDLSKASVVRKGMRQLRVAMRQDVNTCYVVANHVIANIGDRYRPRTTPGGKAVPFQCSVRVELILSNKVIEEKTKRVLGVETIAKVVKNKIIEPFRQCRVRVMYRTGIVPNYHLYETAQAAGVVKQARTRDDDGKLKDAKGWYTMDGVKTKFQAKTFYDKYVDRALAAMNVKQDVVGAPTDDEIAEDEGDPEFVEIGASSS